MKIDYVILGLIKLHKEVTGYELNAIIRDSNQYFITVSLGYIYPILKRLHQNGLVSYTNIPLANRPDKKAYQITPHGDQILQEWLQQPIEADMYFEKFLLKMQFAALMDEDTILHHIDREIARLEDRVQDLGQLSNCIESGKLDPKNCEMISSFSQLLQETDVLRKNWLQTWRAQVEIDERNKAGSF